MKNEKPYLTEKKLVEFCKDLWPDDPYTTNKTIIGLPSNARPDYANLAKKIIVEFDGHRHYTQSKIVMADREKDRIWKENGFKVIRWPYFVQLSNISILEYFGVDMPDFKQIYPHGFIDPSAILPADFCISGLYRFGMEMGTYNFMSIGKEIFDSLRWRIDELKEPAHTVWPSRQDSNFVLETVSFMSSKDDIFEHNFT